MNWVKVTERKPDKPGLYIVTVAADYDAGTLILEYDKNGHWIYEGEPTFCSGSYIEVTHWALRPDPAEADEDES